MTLKKLFAGILSLAAALLAVCAITVCAGAETSGDYEYRVFDDGTVQITDYTGCATELEIPSSILYSYSLIELEDGTLEIANFYGSVDHLEIPSTIATMDGAKVTRIGDHCFDSCESLTSVTIPDTVTSIGDSAFKWCRNLSSITIPDSVKIIGDSSFYVCSSLNSLDIPGSVTSIGNNAFEGCSNLTSIDIHIGVKSIGDSAFERCTNLRSITIPDSVKLIGNRSFYSCSSLTSLDIPGSVTSIGDEAFSACSNLISINILKGLTSIGEYAFYSCLSLTSITIPDSVTSIGIDAFGYCSSLTSIIIPKRVTSIEASVFEDCSNLKSISIPDSVTSIGEYAFKYCSSLTSIDIPDSVTSIGYSAFSGTPFLDNQTTAVKYGGKWVIDCDEDATTATIKNGTVRIADNAFSGCRVTSINIPDSVTSIGDSAFRVCWRLKDVYYTGSKAQWDKISIGEYNDGLLNATIHYNYNPNAPSSVTGLNLKGRAGDALRLAWNKNTSADGYIIERKDGTKWTRVVKIAKNSTTEYRIAKLAAGTTYNFRIRAYKMDGKTALYSGYTTISASTKPSAVSGLKLKGRAGDALRLAWTKNTGADGYIIERKDGNKWVRVVKTSKNTTTEYRISKLKAGTSYNFRICAYKIDGKTALYSGYTNITATTYPSAVSGLKLKTAVKNAVRLSWTKNTNADGYIIEQKSGNKWVRVGKITKNSTVEFRKGGLKSKTSYTFRVTSYKIDGNTALYGAAKTITVKTK